MKYFILLTQSGLVVVAKNHQPQLYSFPPNAIQHQEVKDHKLFEEFLSSIFSHLSKQEALLFLSDELVFSNAVQLTEGLVLEDEIKKFGDNIPFSSETIEKIYVKTKTDVYFFATNSDLYKTVIAVAQKYHCIIKRVVPRSLFGQMIDTQQLSYDMFARAAKENSLMDQGNFLQARKSGNRKRPLGKQLLLLIICLTLLGGVLYWAYTNVGL